MTARSMSCRAICAKSTAGCADGQKQSLVNVGFGVRRSADLLCVSR